MIEHLFAITLAWMTWLAPGRDVGALAWAVAINASSETEAAIMTAVAFRESSLRNDVTGDGGRSVCAFQIFNGSKALLEDPIECARVGVRMLRESRRMDPTSPLSFYARGPRYKSDEAKRISMDRMALAARLMKQR